MKKSAKILYWTPRVICILAILFVSMFALDSFQPGAPFLPQIGGFLIHLIPSYILTGLLVVAWKYEFTGGLLFFLIGIITSPFIFSLNYARNNSVWISLAIILLITFPFIITGILFILSSRVRRKSAKKSG